MDNVINPDLSCRERQDPESALCALLDAYRELRYSIMDGRTKAYLQEQCREIAKLEEAHNRAICQR